MPRIQSQGSNPRIQYRFLLTDGKRRAYEISLYSLYISGSVSAVHPYSRNCSGALKVWYSLPNHHAAGWARMDTFYHNGRSGFANGVVYLSNGNADCVYMRKKPVAHAAVDGDWKRASPNVCGNRAAAFYWNDTFYIPYNGFGFQICHHRAGLPDTCGRQGNIYP